MESVKTAVSHCDRTLGEMTLMTLLLKCKARVITLPSLKARAVTAAEEENTKQCGGEECGRLLEFIDTEHDTDCTGDADFTGEPCCMFIPP